MHPMTAARRPERGSVLMLMPAAVVIVLLLGAISVDSAITYLGQRQARNIAFDAANDAAGVGIDLDALRATGEAVYDADRVSEVAHAAVDGSGADQVRLVDVQIDPEGGVRVTVEVTIRHLFVQAFGGGGRETLRISARAAGEVSDPARAP